MRGEKLVAFTLVLLMAISSTFIGVTFAGPTTIYVSPSEVTADVGETFTVEIWVDGVTDLSAWEFKLRYDTNVLAFPPEVAEGDFLSSVGTTDFRVTTSTMYSYVQVACALQEPVGASGSGVLATITFTVLGGYPGKTDLDLFDTKLYDIDLNPIEHEALPGYFYMTKPVASFTWTPESPIANETIWFNASESFSPIGKNIVLYTWDFGDGSPTISTSGPIITHQYVDYSKDPYMVTLTVTDEDGNTGTLTKPLLIWRDVIASDIWVSDLNLDGSYSVIDPTEVSDYYPPYMLVLTATNLGTQTETFNVTLDFSVPTQIVPLWDNPVTLPPGTGSGFSILALWWPEDAEGNILPPGTYTFTMTCSYVDGELPKYDNTANNVFTKNITIVEAMYGIYTRDDLNEFYLPHGMESNIRFNATATNVGDVTLSNLRFGVYFKGVGYDLSTTDLTLMYNTGAGWSSEYHPALASDYAPSLAAEGWQLCTHIGAPHPSTFSLAPNASQVFYFYVRNEIPLGPMKILVTVWNDTNGNFVFEPELNETILSEGDYPVEVSLNPFHTAQIGYTGKFYYSIQSAIDAASAGDTVIVYPGEYHEHVVVNKANLTLLGAKANVDPWDRTVQGEESIIIGIGGAFGGAPILIDADGVVINGFTVKNPGGDYGIILPSSPLPPDPTKIATVEYNIVTETGYAGIYGYALYGDIIRNNWVVDNDMYGIFIEYYLAPSSENCTIEGNVIERNGEDGICGYTFNFVIKNNNFTDNGCSGMWLWEGEGNIIEGNIIRNCTYGIYLDGHNYAKISECTITNCTYGIYLNEYVDYPPIINYNNIYNNTQYGVDAHEISALTVDARYNWWGNSTGPTHPYNPLGTGDIITDNVDYEPWLAQPYPPAVFAPLTYLEINGPYSTCFEVHVVIANVTDLYGFQFKLTWDPTVAEIAEVHYESKLDLIWGEDNYYASCTYDNAAGELTMAATAMPPAQGFSGTATVLNVVFTVHSNYRATSWIRMPRNFVKLSDSEANPIPTGIIDYYTYEVPKAALEMSVTGHSPEFNATAVSTTFTVDVWLHNAMNVRGYDVIIKYPTDLLDAANVMIHTSDEWFPGPYDTKTWTIDDTAGTIQVTLMQTTDAPPASGDGILFTITFHVVKGITWKQGLDRNLHGIIRFDSSSYITVYNKVTNSYYNLSGSLLNRNIVDYYFVPIPGDVNLDGTVDVKDLYLVATRIGTSYLDYDINNNHSVDVYDLVLVAKHFGS